MSSTGRISKGPDCPDFTPGCCDINWMAWFKSFASSRKNPPNCSLVSVRDHYFAVPDPQYGGVLSDLQRFPADEVTVLPQHFVIGQARIHKGILLVFGHRPPLFLVIVSKANEFHDSSDVRTELPSFVAV